MVTSKYSAESLVSRTLTFAGGRSEVVEFGHLSGAELDQAGLLELEEAKIDFAAGGQATTVAREGHGVDRLLIGLRPVLAQDGDEFLRLPVEPLPLRDVLRVEVVEGEHPLRPVPVPVALTAGVAVPVGQQPHAVSPGVMTSPARRMRSCS